VSAAVFVRDPSHWLLRLSPDEWIAAAMGELHRAEAAYAKNDARAGLIGAKRAAGMALNGALVVAPNETWGRSYVQHVEAVAKDADVPPAVRDACVLLVESKVPGSDLLGLRSKAGDARVLEAAKDVMAHAYAVVKRHET